jgi:AcrR family transcriptional regulator
MSPRHYAMDKRARTADETRRRIVQATYALHAERAIADTSMKDIAARADVGLGTVYHHFPTYNDVVRACGVHTFALASPPDAGIFGDARLLDQRIVRLASALFAFYERCPGIGKARADRDKFPALREAMEQLNDMVTGLVREALRPADDAAMRTPVLVALLDFDVHARLVAAGFGTPEAASLISAVIGAWMNERPRTARQSAKPRRNR